MKLFDALRSWFTPPAEADAPRYGRGIHALPNPRERELFDEASEAFVQRDTLRGYEYFLASLLHEQSDHPLTHLGIEKTEGRIDFLLYQGSALVRGTITSESFEAYADIAVCEGLDVAVKRRFLERNFQLTYGRFSREEGVIRLRIRLDNATVTPQKIFYPLREIALNADFEKEFIAAEFDETILLEYGHVSPLPRERAERLYALMREWIARTRQSLVGLLSNDNSGMVSFSYLALLLQIDYLLMPRKKLAKEINEKINGYFLDDEKLTEDKNAELETYLGELDAIAPETFATQFYTAPYTFSPYEHALHDEIASFIDESLAKVRWYKNNRSHYVISVIYRYIALYILYNYGLHPSLRSLMHLHVEIYAGDFFAAEGDAPLYDSVAKSFDTHRIAQRIASAIDPYTERYKGLRNFADDLNYSDLDHFSQSFYLQIKNLDFTEV